jgi:hypothetical protein
LGNAVAAIAAPLHVKKSRLSISVTSKADVFNCN